MAWLSTARGAGGAGVDGGTGGDADFEGGDAVAKGKVEHKFAADCGGGRELREQNVGGIGELGGLADAEPLPATGVCFGVEIEAAGGGGGDVGAGEGFAREGPAGVEDGGVGEKADDNAGGVAAEVPDGVADDAFGTEGEAVVRGLTVFEAEALDAEVLGVVPFERRRLGGGGEGE